MTATSIPLVKVFGDPYQRGRDLGSQARSQVRGSCEVYRRIFDAYTGLDWDEVRRRAAIYAPLIDEYDDRLTAEMRGIAEGAGLDFEDILALNVRTEVMYGFSTESPRECTAFGAMGGATRTGEEVIVAQNWDWLSMSGENCILLELGGPDCPSLITYVEAGLLAKLGLNEAGIGLASNLLLTDGDRGEPGVPFHVMLRKILMSSTFAEAVEAVVEPKRASSANYLIGSAAEPSVVNVEAQPGGKETVHMIEAVHDYVYHANTFCGPIGTAEDRGHEPLPDSARRTKRIADLLAEAHGSLDVACAANLLGDHDGQPASICRHPDETIDPFHRVVTVGSAIMELKSLRLYLCSGQPCESERHEVVPNFAALQTSIAR